jgi:glycosyltransferase involved in cell wall biosynthesis
MSVIIIQRIFPTYRKDVFDELHNKIDFTLLHSVNKSGINQASTGYSKQIGSFQYSRKESNIFLNVFRYIIKERPAVVIHEFSIGIASLFPVYLLTRILGIGFILWGHGFNRSKGFYPEHTCSDKLRLWLVKKTDATIFYGQEAKIKFSEYVKKDKLFIAFNCLNTRTLTTIRSVLEKEGRDNIKERIGLRHKYNLIFIGRLLEYKQPQILLDIYESLRNHFGDTIGLNFIGDGDYLFILKDIVRSKGFENNVKFYGEISNDIKNGELLYCSDLMVMPGPVGLSLNHAFNFDCPVVTFHQIGHGPEIEYLIDGKTGFIVEPNTLNAMTSIIGNYLTSIDLQIQMKMNIRKMIETTCSINNFIRGFEEAVNFVITKSKGD